MTSIVVRDLIRTESEVMSNIDQSSTTMTRVCEDLDLRRSDDADNKLEIIIDDDDDDMNQEK